MAPLPEHFEAEFMSVSYKNSVYSRKLIKYILGKIDNFYRKTKEEVIDFENVNVEHLLPQKPDKEWELTKDQIKTYVNKLGNLTLVDRVINSKVGNKHIKYKIEILSESGLPINQPLIDELNSTNCVWNEDCIKTRQGEFAKLAYNNIWQIPG